MITGVIMPFLIPIVFSILGLGLVGTMYWHKHKSALARAFSMEALARSLGLSFSAIDSFGLARQLNGFELFKRERSSWLSSGKITNVMRGLVGDTEVYLFDYSYKVQTGNARKTISQTVFFANEKNWFLPNFHLKPENWWHKLQKDFGLSTDINFDENNEFSEQFWLKGEFEDLVRQQFTPSLQGFLTEKPPAHLEGNNYYLIGYKPRKCLDAPDAQLFYKHCCEMVELLREKGNLELLDLAEIKKEEVTSIKDQVASLTRHN